MDAFEAVVVGAGPAGLSAAAELSTTRSCLLLDQGAVAARRSREAPADLVSGIGGAGLFSDGKHSFFPSATTLWQLPDRAALAGAYGATVELLGRYGVAAGPLPDGPAPPLAAGGWCEKRYPSLYVSFADRLACIEALWTASGTRWAEASVVDARRDGDSIVLAVERAGIREQVRTRDVVVATGRWSPRWIRPWLERLGVGFGFQRVELGVRLEAAADHPLFARLPGVDGKLAWRDEASEARTFCTCRDGEVVLGSAHGIAAYSGRADGPRTGRSNVGLLVRSVDHAIEVAHALAAEPVVLDVATWLATGPAAIEPVFGAPAARLLTTALERFVAWEPTVATGGFRAYAPCLEGVGDYPIDDGSLRAASGVWLAGDVIGRFRGIVASMVSGRYAARRITAARR